MANAESTCSLHCTNQEPNFWKLSRSSGLPPGQSKQKSSLHSSGSKLNFNNSHKQLTSDSTIIPSLLHHHQRWHVFIKNVQIEFTVVIKRVQRLTKCKYGI